MPLMDRRKTDAGQICLMPKYNPTSSGKVLHYYDTEIPAWDMETQASRWNAFN